MELVVVRRVDRKVIMSAAIIVTLVPSEKE